MTTWNLTGTQHHILICNGDTCSINGGDDVTLAVRQAIKLHGADPLIHTTRTCCNGRCDDASVLIVYPKGTWYRNVTPEIGKAIVESHLFEGPPLAQHISYTFDHGLTPEAHSEGGVPKRKAVDTSK